MIPFGRHIGGTRNELRQQCAVLIGIVQGLLADQHLSDQDISFLDDWLNNASTVAHTWPGDMIHAQIKAVRADGVISPDERSHLMETLQKLVGGRLDELAESQHVCELMLDPVQRVVIEGRSFCLTGEFAFGPRTKCEAVIVERGGSVQSGITKKLHHVVVGGLGSPEWKSGSFGTKIEKAMEYKRAGVPILIVHEDVWAASVFGESTTP